MSKAILDILEELNEGKKTEYAYSVGDVVSVFGRAIKITKVGASIPLKAEKGYEGQDDDGSPGTVRFLERAIIKLIKKGE